MKGILFVHGLNTTPKIFNDLAAACEARNILICRPHLKGHDPSQALPETIKAADWVNGIHDAMNQNKHVTEWIAVGYSLGGLVIANMALKKPKLFQRIVLLAPALSLKFYAHLPRMILFTDIRLKSFTPAHIRAHNKLSTDYFSALYALRRETRRMIRDRKELPQMTIIMSCHDELISYHGTRKLAQKMGAEFISVKKKRKNIADWGHLIVMRKHLHESDWNLILSKIFK